MSHRTYILAVFVYVFSCCLVADELLSGNRVLPFREPPEVFLANLAAQSPLFGKSPMPLSAYLVALRVIVLAGIGELFRVIRQRLDCTEWIGNGQHRGVGLPEEVTLPCTGSFQFLFAILLGFVLRMFLFWPASSSRRGRCCFLRLVRVDLRWPLDEPRMA